MFTEKITIWWSFFVFTREDDAFIQAIGSTEA